MVLYVWYDNEYGYSYQVIRVLEHMAGARTSRVPEARRGAAREALIGARERGRDQVWIGCDRVSAGYYWIRGRFAKYA